MPFLPVELYRPIIQYIDTPKDLYHLLLTSRVLHVEAEPQLYHTIVCPIEGYDWRLGVVCSSPLKASYIRSLDLRYLILGSHQFSSIYHDFLRAFQWMVNLRHLQLPTEDNGVHGLSFVPSSDCTFRLEALSLGAPRSRWGLTAPSSQTLYTFLESQVELKELDCPYLPLGPGSLPQLFLPKLQTLRAHQGVLCALLPGRPISRLDFGDARELGTLVFIEQTPLTGVMKLRSLSVKDLANLDYLDYLVGCISHLRYLKVDSVRIVYMALSRPSFTANTALR